MKALYSATVSSDYGDKTIAVYSTDILLFEQPIDILTTSAYYRSYAPTPRTLFKALNDVNISVEDLAKNPEFDLRTPCNIWLSRPVASMSLSTWRIGCIELLGRTYNASGQSVTAASEHYLLKAFKAYFQMLDIAATCGVKMDTVALPVLGSGSQRLSASLILIPLVNECIEFLKRNSAVKQIFFIEKDSEKAARCAQVLENSYAIYSEQAALTQSQTVATQAPMAFISYSSKDKNIADNLCAKLEAKGVKVWYAPRNIDGAYATAIAEAIQKATHFVVVLSKNSMSSEHVLNEIDLAFKKLPKAIKFKPLRIDEEEFAPAFEYYLSRQHWMDAYIPPLEERLNEFVNYFMETL